MDNKYQKIPSNNNGVSPSSTISDLLPSDILEEIGMTKMQNPKISVSSNHLKYDSLNDEEINEKISIKNKNESSKFIYHSNMNSIEIIN